MGASTIAKQARSLGISATFVGAAPIGTPTFVQTAGVECRKDEGVLDEIPGAYKDIDAVMAAQADLVSVEHTLKQVLCVKG